MTVHELGVVEWLRPGEFSRVPALLAKLEALNVHRLRTGISWADCHRKGGLDWYAWLLPQLAARVEILPCFHYTPPSLGVANKSSAPPRRPKDYADFLDVFVARFGGHFEWVELWNEPNNLLDWDWRQDPEWRIFAEMAGGAAYWMRRCGKKVVLGGNCPTDLAWLRHIGKAGVLDHVDAIGIHAFPGTWSIDWTSWADELGAVRQTLAELGQPKALWVTEAGVSTWRHDEAGQAREVLALMESSAERAYWYALDDLDADLPTQQGFHVDERHYHMGLFRADGTAKLAARALIAGGREALAQRVALAAPRVRTAAPRIVVTGGAGFLGANMVDRLAGDGESVLVLDSLARPGVEENLSWLLGRHRHRVAAEIADVRDPYIVRDVVKGASAVIHLAAQVAVTTSLLDPVADFEVNGRGTLNVLEAVRHAAPDAPVLFASTNKVFGDLIPRADMVLEGERYLPREQARRRGVDETQPLSFHSPYGCSKGVADQYVLDYARVYGLKTVVLRMSCLYGPHQFGTEDQGWVAHFLIAALSGRPITIFGDGFQVRDVLYVDDAVNAYRLCLKETGRASGHAFNLGGGPDNALSLREFLRLIPEICGVTPEVSYDAWRPGDQAWYVSDTSALAAATGWRAAVPAREGIARLAAWLAARLPAAETREVVA